jgi:hypothetical protein
MGRQLAREHNVKADLVIPVPDSGVCAAMGYSEESGIPYEMAFIRNHYVGRSFLQPTQLIRDFNVRVKLNLIESLVKDKRVVIVDDSIVRGTTCKFARENAEGSRRAEVHVAVSCPPHMNPCVYGIDFPDRSKLMAANNTVDEIRKYLNADSLHYLSQAGMVAATGQPKERFLHGVLRRQLSRALRPAARQAHHRTPPQTDANPRRSGGERRTSRSNCCRFNKPGCKMNGAPKRDWAKTWIHFVCGFVTGGLSGFSSSFDWITALIVAILTGTLAAIFLDRFWDKFCSWW